MEDTFTIQDFDIGFFLFYEITGITKNVDCFHSYILNVNTKKMNRFIWSIKTTSNESAQVTFLLLVLFSNLFFQIWKIGPCDTV